MRLRLRCLVPGLLLSCSLVAGEIGEARKREAEALVSAASAALTTLPAGLIIKVHGSPGETVNVGVVAPGASSVTTKSCTVGQDSSCVIKALSSGDSLSLFGE